MGSSKKHKEKDKERSREHDEKKIHRSKDAKKKKRKSRSPSPEVVKVKRHKEKRKHSDSEFGDGDIPPPKASRSSRAKDASLSRSPSPTGNSGGGGGGDVLSIEETNKLREKLGLKPLQVNSAPPPAQKSEKKDISELTEDELIKIREEREEEADTFWKEKQEFVHAPAENISEKRKADKLREKIASRKEKRRLEAKLLTTKGIADESDDEDASDWVLKQKRMQEEKELAAKRAKALEELDDEFGVGDLVASEFVKDKNRAYSQKDLKGMKVLHGQFRIDVGESVILTLKDQDVLAEDADVLMNVNLVDDEKYEKNVKNRQLRPELHGYNAYDDVEFDTEGNLKEKGVLSKYDEEIDGEQKDEFIIGEDYSEETRRARIRAKMQKSDKILESLELPSLKIASDFYTPDEMVSFKKPKKKIRKVRKTLKADDLLKIDNSTAAGFNEKNSDLGSRSKRRKGESAVKVESVENDIKTEPQNMEIDLEVDDLPPAPEIDVSDVKLEDEGDADFQRALEKARLRKQKEQALNSMKKKQEKMAALLLADTDSGTSALEGRGESSKSQSIVLDATAEFCRTLGDIPSYGGSDIYGTEVMDFEQEGKQNREDLDERGKWNEVDIDETPVDITRQPDYDDTPILDLEPSVGSGLAGALTLATKKGYLDREVVKRGAGSSMRHLQAQHYSIEDKNYEDDRSSKRDFYSGPLTDFKEKEGYKPEFKLDYVDEDGQVMSQKEAFRLLSHKFHGKGSGKNKIDKKRRKFEQEKLMQQMNSTDTPLNTVELFHQRQKETHSPYVVLSGTGSKAGPSSLSKSKR